MTHFYQLTPKEQSNRLQRLAAKALEAWGIGQHAKLELISHRENAVYQVETSDEKYVMRVHRWGYHSDEALRSELQWMEALSHNGIETPEIIKTVQGESFITVKVADVPEPRQVDLFQWIDGVPISDLTEKGNELTMHRSIGELMARMHNQASEWILPSGFTRHAWDVEGLLGDQPLWGRFWEMEHFDNTQREKIHESRIAAKHQLQEFGHSEDRYGLIHCDFLPENLLKHGEKVRVIDFDDCGFGWHMFDIVTSLYTYSYLPNFNSILTAFLEGYRRWRDLSDDQVEAFEFFLLLRIMTTCGWLYTRFETEAARQYSDVMAKALIARVDAYLNDTRST